MSKFCICLKESAIIEDRIRVKNLLGKYGLAAFFEMEYEEPFLKQLETKDGSLIISIADSKKYDNCEMLLLPDGCSINYRENKIPFQERMMQMQEVLKTILDYGEKIDLFIGNSGVDLSEFDECEVCVDDFSMAANRLLNTKQSVDVHFKLSNK